MLRALALVQTPHRTDDDGSWRMDETYVKVRGECVYLYLLSRAQEPRFTVKGQCEYA